LTLSYSVLLNVVADFWLNFWVRNVMEAVSWTVLNFYHWDPFPLKLGTKVLGTNYIRGTMLLSCYFQIMCLHNACVAVPFVI
jgi:hypothetical protein